MDSKLLDYFSGNELAASVWKGKYAAPGEETPDDMHRRMAKEFARIRCRKDTSKTEKEWIDHFFLLFKGFKQIIPQGRIMAGIGRTETFRSLSNCTVLKSPMDGYGSILYTDAMLIAAAKRGMGYGLDLSNLRPEGCAVTNAAATSTGLASFMDRFSNSTREVAQNSRRGACLLSIDVRHPDTDKFVKAKDNRDKVTGANVSVKLNDDFMRCVEQDAYYYQHWPITEPLLESDIILLQSSPEGELIELCGNPWKLGKRIRARKLFDMIVDHAHRNAEPGVFFWDRVMDFDPASVYEEFTPICTNACGEQPMAFGDSCRLLVINLLGIVNEPFTSGANLNYSKLAYLAEESAKLGDDIVDLEIEYGNRILNKVLSDPEPYEEKIPEIKFWEKVLSNAERGRRTGCGITALGDMLAAIGVKFDSPEALTIVSNVMRVKQEAELRAGIDMAKTYGPFPAWDNTLEYPYGKPANSFYAHLQKEFPKLVAEMQLVGRRAINWSTIAPCGSISILATGPTSCNLSSGCEPQFSLMYTRKRKINPSDVGARVDFVDQSGDSWTEYPVLMGAFRDWLMARGLAPDDMTKTELNRFYEESPWYNACSHDIDWGVRVEMQSVLNKYTTSAISTTLNLPENVSKETVSSIYLKSWKLGNKGQTIYREGSRTGVLVSATKAEEFSEHDAPKRPKQLAGEIHHTVSMGTKWTFTVGLMNGKPYEMFATPGHYGLNNQRGVIEKRTRGAYTFYVDDEIIIANVLDSLKDEEEALTRLISTSLRHGAALDFVAEQLSKTNGSVVSFSKAAARILRKYSNTLKADGVRCESCGSTDMIRSEGCMSCRSCGSSKCG